MRGKTIVSLVRNIQNPRPESMTILIEEHAPKSVQVIKKKRIWHSATGTKEAKPTKIELIYHFVHFFFFLFSVKYKSPLTERSFPTVNLETEFKKNYASPSRKYFTRNYRFACPRICGTLFPGLHRHPSATVSVKELRIREKSINYLH